MILANAYLNAPCKENIYLRQAQNTVNTEERLQYRYKVYMVSIRQVSLGNQCSRSSLKRTFASNRHESTLMCTSEETGVKMGCNTMSYCFLCGWCLGIQPLTWNYNEVYWIGIWNQRQQVWATHCLLGRQCWTISYGRREIFTENKVRLLCCGGCGNNQICLIWV